MPTIPDISQIAGLLADPSRSAMLISLLDGRPLTATELAQRARITPQTASSHLSKLVTGNLVTREVQGRYRYYRLANSHVAHAIESLIAISAPAEIHSLKDWEEINALKAARTCYDHLAGKLGVDIAASLLTKGYIEISGTEFEITSWGQQFFDDFGIDIAKIRRKHRKFIHSCMDWSEHTPHVGGAIGAALLDKLTELGWIFQKAQSRAVEITNEGKLGFRKYFDIKI